ncbi:MAG: hypothetical protein HUJ63_04020, partial [Enterococcus sp.]|nr:hypothetical protein [Enterococcus sp.]
LSHASLIKAYIDGNYPECGDVEKTETETETQTLKPERKLLTGLKVGKTVIHQRFGEGVILEISNDKVKVDFNDFGVKILSIQFANLTCK